MPESSVHSRSGKLYDAVKSLRFWLGMSKEGEVIELSEKTLNEFAQMQLPLGKFWEVYELVQRDRNAVNRVIDLIKQTPEPRRGFLLHRHPIAGDESGVAEDEDNDNSK